MTSPHALRNLLLKSTLGGLVGLGFGFGCVLTSGGTDECDCIACNSHMEETDENGDGKLECVCDAGYQWAEPGDPNNFDCDSAPPKPGTSDCVESYHVQVGDRCHCVSGFDWCDPDDDDDLSCCEVSGGTGQGPGTGADDGVATGDDVADGTADETGGGEVCSEEPTEWNGVEPPADACNADVVGMAFFCSNTLDEGPAGSRYWECEESGWAERPEFLEQDCVELQGHQFAIGCVDDGVDIIPVCGDGPGTDCSGPECDACADSDVYAYCDFGKLHSMSCATLCSETGVDGITFESGYCTQDAVDGITCACCDSDSGDENCPV